MSNQADIIQTRAAVRDLVHKHTWFGLFGILYDLLVEEVKMLELNNTKPEVVLRATRWRNAMKAIIDGSTVRPSKFW